MTNEQLEKLAEILAEKIIINMTNYFEKTQSAFEPMSPEQFFHHQVDGFGNVKHSSRKDLLALQLNQLEEQRSKLLNEEKYELLIELQEIYDKIKKEYDNL